MVTFNSIKFSRVYNDKMNKRVLTFFGFGILILLVLTIFVSGETTTPENYLILESVEHTEHKINYPYELKTFVYSSDSGVLKNSSNNITCFYNLYSEFSNWGSITSDYLIADEQGFKADINRTDLTQVGDYSILLNCVCSDCIENVSLVGGFKQIDFKVYNPSESKEFSYNYDLFVILILSLLIGVSLAVGNIVLGILSSIGVLIYGVTIVLNSTLIGFLVIIAGLFLAMYFGFKEY